MLSRRWVALLCLLVLICTVPAWAATAGNTPDKGLPEVGVSPRSPLYVFVRLMERLELALARDPEAKARLMLRQAEKRLAEITALAGAEDAQGAAALERAMALFNELSGAARARAEQAGQRGRDIEELLAHLETVQSKSITVLTRVSEQVPEQARETILSVLEGQKQRMIEIRQRIRDIRGKGRLDDDPTDGKDATVGGSQGKQGSAPAAPGTPRTPGNPAAPSNPGPGNPAPSPGAPVTPPRPGR
ncbi:MAG: DUF5667 domain-containing protein [Bacillota bacterium]